MKWAAELRKAFDAVDVSGGDAGRTQAWRALVAQVAAAPNAVTAAAAKRLADARAPDAAAAPTDVDATTSPVFARLAESVTRWAPSVDALAIATGIERAAIGAGDDHLAALREQIETLRHSVAALPSWVAFHTARRAALEAGVGPAVAAIERGDLAAAELAGAWERATLLAWADAELAETPVLEHFHGATHHAHVAAFADLDRAMLALVRSRALARIAERVPRPPRRGAIDEGGELGALLLAAKKPATITSLRALLAQLPTLLPRVAPCMMMTPVAIAEHLDPSLPAFDLVLFDEARSSRRRIARRLARAKRSWSSVIRTRCDRPASCRASSTRRSLRGCRSCA